MLILIEAWVRRVATAVGPNTDDILTRFYQNCSFQTPSER